MVCADHNGVCGSWWTPIRCVSKRPDKQARSSRGQLLYTSREESCGAAASHLYIVIRGTVETHFGASRFAMP